MFQWMLLSLRMLNILKDLSFIKKSLKLLICDKVLTVSQFVSFVWQTSIISSEKSICVGGGSKKCETRHIENSIRNIWRHQSMTIFSICVLHYMKVLWLTKYKQPFMKKWKHALFNGSLLVKMTTLDYLINDAKSGCNFTLLA